MQRFPFSSLGRRFGSIPYTQELHTSGTRASSCSAALGRKFGSVFLPSVVHKLASVIADVKSGNVLWTVDRMARGNIVLLWSQRDISLNFQE